MRSLIVFALVFGANLTILADTIRLKDGSVIRGQIVSFKNEQFTIVVGSGATTPGVTDPLIPLATPPAVIYASPPGEIPG